MVRHLARVIGLIALASLVFVPATSAAADRAAGADIRVLAAHVELNPDGTVSVPVRVRCYPPLDAFELDVSVRQGSTFGSVSLIGTEFPVCNGRWQRTTVTVTAENGTFGPGPATVDVFLGVFDPVAGSDVSAEDSATVRL